MKRRSLVTGVGSLVAGSSLLVGSGAFTALTSDRVATVDMVGDAAGMLGLTPHTGPNGAYALTRGGQLVLDGSQSNGELPNDGMNSDSLVRVDRVFNVSNQGTQPVLVWITHDSTRVAFTTVTDGHGTIDGEGNAIPVPVGQTIEVGFLADTHGGTVGETVLSGISVHAVVSGEGTAPGGGDGGDGGATAPSYPEVQLGKLTATDHTVGDFFGTDVALDGDTALVGALLDDPKGRSSGSAYVFTRSSGLWSQQTKLVPSDGDDDDVFGASVALDGETAVIGAPGDEDPNGDAAGSAYVYTRSGSTWLQQAKLTAGDGAGDDRFGRSVAVDGDTVLIGAFGDDSERGAAYVFTRSGSSWTLESKLTTSNPDRFGLSVALSGDTALVGAPTSPEISGSSIDRPGAAYVFTRDGSSWTRRAELTAADGDDGDRFGDSVSLDGDTAIVGAPADEDPYGQQGGSAYVFTGSASTWTQETKLSAGDGDTEDRFGTSVGVDGDTAVVGAAGDEDPNGDSAGSAYVFTRSGSAWTQQTKLSATDGGSGDTFGGAVVLDGSTALIGALGGEAAYVFGEFVFTSPDSDGTIGGL